MSPNKEATTTTALPRTIGKQRREARACRNLHSIEDLRALAARKVPTAIMDFVDGGAEQEINLRRVRDTFAQIEFQPKVLAGVSTVDTQVTLFGVEHSMPLVLGPTGLMRLSHPEAEKPVVCAASESRIPFTLSTMSSLSLETVAEHGASTRRWFQLYLTKDDDLNLALIRRAEASDYNALVVTVDTPVVGLRLRDIRNGLTIPPSITTRTIADLTRRPRWWSGIVRQGGLQFGSLASNGPLPHKDLINGLFRPTTSIVDLKRIRDWWPGPLVVKGIQTVEDGLRVEALGVDGIVLSDHGGRQLDRSPAPLKVLPHLRRELTEGMPIFLDSGVRSGADVAAAISLGATACFIARPYLYGLMAAGQTGVRRVLEIFHDDLVRTMTLLGVSKLSELGDSHVRVL